MDLEEAVLRTTEVSPRYWRVTIDNPPLNLFDPRMLAETNLLLDRMDAAPDLHVVVFTSADPDYFIAHIDLQRWTETFDGPGGAAYSEWPTTVSRLTESRVISIASVRGRARGHGNEFALACDMRFASRERAVFGQLEVALGVVPGGGGIEWLSALLGRSRALEAVLSSQDFDADTAETYGWINRSLPDAELDDFVEALAQRLAGFDGDVLRLAKASINARAGVPSHAQRWQSNASFHAGAELSTRRGTSPVPAAFAAGLQQPGDFERDLGARLATSTREHPAAATPSERG